jgi:major membrane immunogen (membrane-anchored lipoprotein)
MRKQSFGTVVLLIIIMFSLTQVGACGHSENERFIQGEWQAAGEQGSGYAWFIRWKFKQGNFVQTGYPPLEQAGKYRVLSEKDDDLELEFFDQSGTFGTNVQRVKIVLDKINRSLLLEGRVFHFVNKH